jgi:hypothetical protein
MANSNEAIDGMTLGHEAFGSRASESSAKATVRSLAFAILAGLGLALALNAAVCFLPEDAYQRWKILDSSLNGRLRWIYERINYDPRPIDVVILGDSRAQLGFSAAAIEQQLAERGKDANVVNFGIFGQGRNIEWVILDEVFKAKSPKLVVVEVEDPPDPFGHELFRDVASPEAIVSAPKENLHQYLFDLAYLPRRKFKLFFANLFPELFGLPKQFDPQAYELNRTDFTTNFLSEFGKMVDMMHPVPREILLGQKSEQASLLQWLAREYARRNGGGNRFYIRKIAEEAKAHGAHLIFDYVPAFRTPETVGDLGFLKQYGPVIDNNDLAPRDELFKDSTHLNHAGAVAATARLTDAIDHLDDF